ncbi:GATA transcription factor 15-like [Phragmites australis]|uniref:GATA transcription factor 15-like n=1 Tax=Phragmites australis TaxID=29695 RepID=UPI002D774CBA|nr:GATA transcription factor 15-like [Phragmites australis]
MLQELAPCTCGLLYAGGCGGRCGRAAASAFSMLFPMAGGQCYNREEEEKGGSRYGGGPVDCTLSLGTPSTRRAEARAGLARDAASTRACSGRQDGGGVSCKESGRGLPARRCANCDTTSTPLWRNGPRGPKSLCNACGIRYKKEERRAAAAVAPAPQDSGVGAYACGGYARQQHPPQWGCYGPAAAKPASYTMYGDVVDEAADGPCLSWMLNVMPSSPAFAVRERPTLFQYY